MLDSGGMPLVRENYQEHVRKAFDQYQQYQERTPAEYSRQEIRDRIQMGVGKLNSSLSDEAMERWLERGVAQNPETGKYFFVRDYRLSLNTPPQMGFDQLDELWKGLAESDVEILLLNATERTKVQGVTNAKKNLYIQKYAQFVQ